MAEFIAILSIYYMCDAVASMRPMGVAEAQACAETYEAVKVYFIPDRDLAPKGTLKRFEQDMAGHRGFKSWEIDNADTVAHLKQGAERSVRSAKIARH